jgi:hypothetical protein
MQDGKTFMAPENQRRGGLISLLLFNLFVVPHGAG